MEPTELSMHALVAPIPDPRTAWNQDHRRLDILVLALCAILSGADSAVRVATFAQAKLPWFRRLRDLPYGAPSHDSFRRVFAALDPAQLQTAFQSWGQAVHLTSKGEVVAIDGNVLRGSADKTWGRAAMQMGSAWATRNGVVMGQQKVAGDSHELTAVPALLARLALEGWSVTLDAAHCQTNTIAVIRPQQADDVVTVKGNQTTLHQQIQHAFAHANATNVHDLAPGQWDPYHGTAQGDGRTERRSDWTLLPPAVLAACNADGRWRDLHAIGMVRAKRTRNGKTSLEERSFILSLDGSAPTFGNAVRLHWEIENGIHSTLDVTFGEDAARAVVGHGPENLAVMRPLALNLLKKAPSKQRIRTKRQRTGWDEEFLLKVLAGYYAKALTKRRTTRRKRARRHKGQLYQSLCDWCLAKQTAPYA